ncbi:MAG TPA: DUF309 domain-containing protein [Acidothermaceae bacterium]
MSIERDRDPSGRARNARPRDGLGRPLPRGSGDGSERVPDELHMSVDDTVAFAQRYLDSGRPFHAHEVLEALWKTQPAGERDLWQGLAQIAVGLTHAMRGNTVGATTLLRRGAGRVADYRGDTHGIDIDVVLTWADALAAAPGVPPPPLALRADR